MRKLFNFSNHVINGIWAALFGLTLYCAWTLSNLAIGDNWKYGQSTTMISTGFVIAVVVLAISLWAFAPFARLMHIIFIKYRVKTAIVLFGLIFVCQIIFVAFVHPEVGFDAGMLHYAAVSAKHTQDVNVMGYYSLNQNNLPITLFMHWLTEITGQTSWQFFDFITLAFVDISAVLNIIAIALLRKHTLGIAIYVHDAWLAVFPWIIVPYTDCWVLPLVSGLFLGYALLHRQLVWWQQALTYAFMGIDTVLIYFIKPSSFIPLIAMVLTTALWWLISPRHFSKRGAVSVAIACTFFVVSAGSTYLAVNHTVKNQTWIQVDSKRNIPAIHFPAMGVYGEGGYSAKQALMMAVLPTKKEKTDYSVKMLKKRLKQLGPIGYIRFLMYKQGNNTADGSFAWLKEGGFFQVNQKPKETNFKEFLENFVFLYGRNVQDFRFLAQVWWVMLLSVIAIASIGVRTKLQVMLRMAMVGGFVFLLLFEGGRSRYLIQFLPILLIQGSLSFEPAIFRIRRLFTWGSDQILDHPDAKSEV